MRTWLKTDNPEIQENELLVSFSRIAPEVV